VKKTGLILIVLVAALLATASNASAAAGRLTKQTKGGGTYYVSAPPGAGPKRPCPVLIAIHGDGYDAKTYEGDWKKYTTKAGYILVLPEKRNHTQGGWSAKDIEDINDMIDDVRKTYGVGARMIAVAGHSSGVTVALDLALNRPSQISALVGFAGRITPNAKQLGSIQKFGVCLIHGTADNIVNISASRNAEKIFKTAGYTVVLKEVAGHTHSTPFPANAMNDAMGFLASWFKSKARVLGKVGAEDAFEWTETEAALEEVKKGEKPGLVYVYSQKDTKNAMAQFLEWDLFPSEDFKAKVGDFVLFRVDRDENKELAKKLKAKKCTLMIVDKNLKKLKGYNKPPTTKKLYADIKKILKKYEKERKKKEKEKDK
jgi:poly(3-hydroxybutyrate) depolymerase